LPASSCAYSKPVCAGVVMLLRALWRLVLTGGLAGGQGDAQAEQQGFG
jgi:hypothetical protein